MVPTGQDLPRPGLGRLRARGQETVGPGRRSRARPGPACGDQSEARPPHFAARCYVSQRSSILGTGAAPLVFAPSFDSMASCEIHSRRERHWHVNGHDPSSGASVPIGAHSAMPRGIRSMPQSRETGGVGTTGTTVVRKQLDLPLIGLRQETARSTGSIRSSTSSAGGASGRSSGSRARWTTFLGLRSRSTSPGPSRQRRSADSCGSSCCQWKR